MNTKGIEGIIILELLLYYSYHEEADDGGNDTDAESSENISTAGCRRMATNPATAPVQAPTVVGFLFTIQSMSIQVVAAAAVAIWVTRKALAARPSAARPLPALKPNHPNQRNDIPMNTKVML